MRFPSIHKGFSLQPSNQYKPAQAPTRHKIGHSEAHFISSRDLVELAVSLLLLAGHFWQWGRLDVFEVPSFAKNMLFDRFDTWLARAIAIEKKSGMGRQKSMIVIEAHRQ